MDQFKLTLMRIEREKAKHTGGMEPMTSLSQGMHSTAVLQPLPGVSQFIKNLPVHLTVESIPSNS